MTYDEFAQEFRNLCERYIDALEIDDINDICHETLENFQTIGGENENENSE